MAILNHDIYCETKYFCLPIYLSTIFKTKDEVRTNVFSNLTFKTKLKKTMDNPVTHWIYSCHYRFGAGEIVQWG